ncbi:HD domain-containing phosphohydrolase [Desulfosarcina ovata]|uniref:Uncharacterized protein n=1 Tax=Desulfosarcina ovata subsp. ovata TaxID=2752305 RepID=A0A5K8AE64_9BACT|nr:HD domain-containing phosphohydrolase [Desulfosarcina ovata]BBO90788.1 hypothetical protein DSCOOX_39680 [Desulfosarcina ovata subsp. ovata]
MHVGTNLFRSRIARRIFTTFIVSALVPVVVLAALSMFQVIRQLEQSGHEALYRATRNHVHAIFEHLVLCEDELKLVDHRSLQERVRQAEKFSAIGRRYHDGRYEAILGDPISDIDLNDQAIIYLQSGKSLLVIAENDPTKITLVRYADSASMRKGLLLGTMRGDYLWGLVKGNTLPAVSAFAVVTRSKLPLYSGIDASGWAAACLPHMDEKHARVTLDGKEWWLAGSLIFLQAQFGMDDWYLMVLQPADYAMAPVARFKLIFLLVVALALLLVVGMSLFNLRRSLVPIDALKAGARHIAHRNFDYRVEIDSNDEFEELAHGFNNMSSQLGQQFRFLSIQEKIDQATLMARDFGEIAGMAITRMLKEFNFSMLAICRVNVDDSEDALIYVGNSSTLGTINTYPFTIDAGRLDNFYRDLPWLTFTDPMVLRRYLPTERFGEKVPMSLFPIFIKDRLYALLYVVEKSGDTESESALPLMRQMADHLAVAWSNINMIKDLRRLTLGSMQALARAVDAKSSWTAGHSARVMRIALSIARQMGLDAERIDCIQQAALLHDIGKIGVSSAILDKPGRLTDAEFTTIRSHPVTGEKILAPIAAFKKILPMVRQHHERWDGKGYPDGLAGTAVTLEARILAVADVYDAIASDRPYRKGMPISKVMEIVVSESGSQFDPDVVDAFMVLMSQKSGLAA